MRGKMRQKTISNNTFSKLCQERQIRNGAVIFFKSFESRFDFFKSGLTNVDLNSFGKEPVLRDRLTIHVIIGTILSIQ